MAKSKSFLQQLKKLKENLEEVRDDFLYEMAETAVRVTPVDTGAYALSHAITTHSNLGRGYTSHGRPRKQDEESFRQQSYNGMVEDISGIPKETTKIYITNRSPHANFVEEKYSVFGTLRNVAPRVADVVLARVKNI